MSGTTCAVCLEEAKSPVAVPCGHIHCDACLIQCIQASEDAALCPCPTCRAPFTTTIPDLHLVPAKYHLYMSPSIRRVYPSSADIIQTLETRVNELRNERVTLKNRIKKLEEEAKRLKLEKKTCMDDYAASQRAMARTREKKQQLRLDVATLTEERDTATKETSEWKVKYRELEIRCNSLMQAVAQSTSSASHSSSSSHGTKRTTSATTPDTHSKDNSSASSSSDPRLARPLPKRANRPATIRISPDSLNASSVEPSHDEGIDNSSASETLLILPPPPKRQKRLLSSNVTSSRLSSILQPPPAAKEKHESYSRELVEASARRAIALSRPAPSRPSAPDERDPGPSTRPQPPHPPSAFVHLLAASFGRSARHLGSVQARAPEASGPVAATGARKLPRVNLILPRPPEAKNAGAGPPATR